MKVPAFIDDLLNRRVRCAKAHLKATAKLKLWLATNRITLPDGLDLDSLKDAEVIQSMIRAEILRKD